MDVKAIDSTVSRIEKRQKQGVKYLILIDMSGLWVFTVWVKVGHQMAHVWAYKPAACLPAPSTTLLQRRAAM